MNYIFNLLFQSFFSSKLEFTRSPKRNITGFYFNQTNQTWREGEYKNKKSVTSPLAPAVACSVAETKRLCCWIRGLGCLAAWKAAVKPIELCPRWSRVASPQHQQQRHRGNQQPPASPAPLSHRCCSTEEADKDDQL